jgi:hypothetical protein
MYAPPLLNAIGERKLVKSKHRFAIFTVYPFKACLFFKCITQAHHIQNVPTRIAIFPMPSIWVDTVEQKIKLFEPMLHTSGMYPATLSCTRLAVALAYHPEYNDRASWSSLKIGLPFSPCTHLRLVSFLSA